MVKLYAAFSFFSTDLEVTFEVMLTPYTCAAVTTVVTVTLAVLDVSLFDVAFTVVEYVSAVESLTLNVISVELPAPR